MGNKISTSKQDDKVANVVQVSEVKQNSKSHSSITYENSTNNGEEDDDNDLPMKSTTKALATPILGIEEESGNQISNSSEYPTPTGREYDLIDQIASELPSIIDSESSQQVQDYIEACNNGKGPMVACYSTAEYLSLFLRKHREASLLYENTCFRPKDDKSPNGILVDNGRSKAYPPACFNLAQMRMTGKGNTKFDRKEGYDLFDRACRAGHGGSCHMQAKMLSSYPGSLGQGIPYNPQKAASLLQTVCDNGDSLSCFTLATMLLRGNLVNSEADNVSPDEARGLAPIKKRKNESDRSKAKDDARVSLDRDPKRAEKILLLACEQRGHAPSCYNLAVMYTQGDDGVPKDETKAKKFQDKTHELVDKFGGFGFGGSMG